MDVLNCFVVDLARTVGRNQTVLNQPVAINHQYVFYSPGSFIKNRFAEVVPHLIQILPAVDAVHAQGDPSHNRLFLFNNQTGVALSCAQIEEILDKQR